MFVKITTIALMAVIATSRGEKVWDGLSAKWSMNHTDAFYSLPQSLKDAESQGWTEITGIEASRGVTAMGYDGDPRLVLLFANLTGKVHGHQVGIPVAAVKNPEFPINYTANPAMKKRTLNGQEYYTATALYHEDEQNNTRRIWFEVDGEFVEIPTKPDQITRETSYYLKKCAIWMGLHYYKIDSTTDCTVLFPWNPLRVQDDIIGLSFQTMTSPTAAPTRTWFEDIPASAIAVTIPDAPACLAEAVAEYGLTSIHVWFKKDPKNIICADECTAVYNSTRGSEQPSDDSGKRRKRSVGSANICPV